MFLQNCGTKPKDYTAQQPRRQLYKIILSSDAMTGEKSVVKQLKNRHTPIGHDSIVNIFYSPFVIMFLSESTLMKYKSR
jgi:hypothetical protein